MIDPIYGTIKIRRRNRWLASPPEGLRQDWTEWQVCQGRRVVMRGDTEDQCMKWLRANITDKSALKHISIVR